MNASSLQKITGANYFATIRLTCFFMLLLSIPAYAQTMDEKIKTLANEIADQIVKSGNKKVAVTAFDYKDCTTEFGKTLAEDLTGYLSVSGRNLTVVNQKLLNNLLEQNKLTAKGLLETKNDAAKLGQVSGINALVYGTITTINEEVRISVSTVKLPTLEVFGFTKSSFPLTKGIREMLPCATEPTPGPEPGPGPNPTADCRAKNSCVVCATNRSAINIKASLYGQREQFYIHPSETKCWKEVVINQNRDHDDVNIYFKNDQNQVVGREKFVIEPCKTYSRVHTK